MNWRDIGIGAIVTLVVTIAGGVIVYYVTGGREAEEKLEYSVDLPTTFQTQANNVAITTIRFSNVGTKTANDVRFSISVEPSRDITDRSVSLSSSVGNIGNVQTSLRNPQTLVGSVQTLLPRETLTLSLLLDGALNRDPAVAIRSNMSVGVQQDTIEDASEGEPIPRALYFVLIPSLLVVQLVLFNRLTALRRRRAQAQRSLSLAGPSLNNVGFALLHAGVNDAASKILEESATKGETGSYSLSNYAASLAMNGDFELANKYINAALLYPQDGESMSICKINETIVALLEGDKPKALQSFRVALNEDRKDIIKYYEKSVIFQNFSREHPELRQIVTEATENPRKKLTE